MSTEAGLEVRERVPLAPFTTLGVGGDARWFATASRESHVAAGYAWCRERSLPLLILGGGSNLVVADRGFDGLVLQMAIAGVSFDEQAGTTLARAGAGESWDAFVASTVDRNLAGLECLSGIPGTVGGTPIQNVGAYGQDVAECIQTVSAFDTQTAAMVDLAASECDFTYRMSRFKSVPGRHVVTGVTFRLTGGEPRVRYPDLAAWLERAQIPCPTLADVRRGVIAIRRTKGMVVDPADPDSRSVGSFFMNPIVPAEMQDTIGRAAGEAPPAFSAGADRVKIPAAWLIERSGFSRGHAAGAVGISTKHPLALINRGRATARDVLQLATRIKRQVADRFGVSLRPEPVFVGFDDDSSVKYLQS